MPIEIYPQIRNAAYKLTKKAGEIAYRNRKTRAAFNASASMLSGIGNLFLTIDAGQLRLELLKSHVKLLRDGFIKARGEKPRIDWGPDFITPVLTSEEMVFYLLPVLKLAKSTNSSLFFIETGAYSQFQAVRISIEQLGLGISAHVYKIAGGTKSKMPENEKLANRIHGFLSQFVRDPGETRALLELHELIKLEPANFIDDAMETIYLNRDELTESVAWMVNNGKKVELVRENFGTERGNGTKAKFQDAVYEHMKKLFPKRVERANAYLNELYKYTQKYLIEKSRSHSFKNEDKIRSIVNSLRLSFSDKNIVYCDDVIASGSSYFQALLFHKVISGGEFRFNEFYHYISNSPLNKTSISSWIPFPEDASEMIGVYYKDNRRIEFKHHTFTSAEENKYARFINLLDKKFAGNNFFSVKELNPGCEMQDAKRIIVSYLLAPKHPLHMLALRTIGHNNLVNYIKENLDRFKPLLNEEIKREYEEVETIHGKKMETKLYDLHQEFVRKLRITSSFFRKYQKEISNYLNRSNGFGGALSEQIDFLTLTVLFYEYVLKKGIFNKGY